MKEILISKDYEQLKEEKNNEKEKSHFLHKFFFFRFFDLLMIAKKRKLNLEDISKYNKNNEDINSNIKEELYKGISNKESILNFLIRKNSSKIFVILFLSLLRIILMILNPFLFKQFSKSNINILHLIISILIIDILRTSLSLQIELKSNLLCLSIDNQIKQIIIKHELLTESGDENKSKNEKISQYNTIFNNDIETIKHFFYLFPNFFSIPILFFSYYLILYFLFGFTSLISFLLLIIIIFINIHLQGKLKLGQKNKQSAIDERMKFMTNLIYKIKNIQILLYEKFFYNKILEKRNNELNQYKILYQTANKIRSLLWASPTLLILITIICHILYCIHNNIKMQIENLLIIFGIIDSFQQPILTFCQTYSSYLIAGVCCTRIEKYLYSKNNKAKNENKGIKYDDIKIDKNEIIFIIGDTGSGKSFLLKNLYNFHKKNNINQNMHLIYNGQEPFILNDTIQSNILFTKDKNSIDKNNYIQILKNCCLENDLSNMEKGDISKSGEGGSYLSGGQKKRICLARVLLDAENNQLKKQILFLDEPTYSLDPETLINIWNNCFINNLKNTTRIIATNNLDLIKYGNKIIYVENKKIIFCGSYDEFKNNKEIYEKYLKLDNSFKERNIKKIKDINSLNNNKNINISQSSKKYATSVNNIMNKKKEDNKMKIYNDFISILLCGYKNFFILIFILLIWIFLRFYSEYFLFIFKNSNNSNQSIKNLIILYILINLFACLLLYLRLVLTSKYTISGGRNLHLMMLDNVINFSSLKSQQMNSNQLINIFSRDLGMVDFFSSVMFGNCLTFGGSFISLLLVIIKFFHIFIIFVPVFIIIGFLLTKIYLVGFRQLVQLETQMRTQIINFIKEINLGKEEIQSYNVSNKFIIRYNKIYKKYYQAHSCFKNSNAWFLYSLSRISFIIKLIFMFYFYYQIKNDNTQIFQDKIGIIFISMFSIHEYFNRFLSHVVTFQNSLMAFNRCLNVKNSNKKNIEINLDSNIHFKGLMKEIKFDNVCVKYNKEAENVLKNISFKILKGEKIGICGRTGVGKTTLLMSLLKLVDINEGKILFDETIDINNVDINTLRQNIICITQDINLFDELTIKENIDPYDKHNKNEIKVILENYSFDKYINNEKENGAFIDLEKIINIKIKDLNLSFGQKSIICLIRAILRFHENKNSIVLIDEMTDKNDFITSDKIMNLLINKFKEATILIVSHRMISFQSCDKILVLEEGKIAEFDTPKKLLSDKNSIFYKYYNIYK